MMKRHEVQVLRRAGHSGEDVAARTGVSVPTIRHIDDEAPVAHVDTARARQERGVGRPRQIEAWRPFVEAILAEEPFVDSFLSWCDAEALNVLDASPIADGIRYARNQRGGLARFLEDVGCRFTTT